MYWRVHWDAPGTFSPENAWSAPWGTASTADECALCDEDGEMFDEALNEFVPCPYHGQANRSEGYSCCESRQALVEYFAARGGCAGRQRIVIFAGQVASFGPDMEALVVPTMTKPRPRWTTWGRITRRGISAERGDGNESNTKVCRCDPRGGKSQSGARSRDGRCEGAAGGRERPVGGSRSL